MTKPNIYNSFITIFQQDCKLRSHDIYTQINAKSAWVMKDAFGWIDAERGIDDERRT